MTQIDFLDQLGRELDGAAGRLIRDQRRSPFRALLAPAAALAVVAAVAVAVWPSAPADPEREVSATGGLEPLARILAVVRRPENEADRSAVATEGREALAKQVSGESAFRLVATTPDGKGVVLAAAEQVPFREFAAQARPGAPPSEPQVTHDAGVCLYHPGARHGIPCWRAEDITDVHAFVGVGDDLHGLAPDGVASAVVSVQDEDLRAPVRDNYFALVPEYEGSDEIAAVVFYDDHGEVVAQSLGGGAGVPVSAVPDETLRDAQALTRAPDPPVGEGPVRDVAKAVNDASRNLPFPPGVDQVLTVATQEDLDRIQTTGDAQGLAERRAQCAWLRYWLAATEASAGESAEQAAKVIETVPEWPTMRARADEQRVAVFETRNRQGAAVARRVGQSCNGPALSTPPRREP